MASDFKYIAVPVGTSLTNDSTPDAKVGLEVLREARALMERGLTGKEVIASLSVKWGAKEVIVAIAAAMGQRNFYDAVMRGKLYGANASPDEAS